MPKKKKVTKKAKAHARRQTGKKQTKKGRTADGRFAAKKPGKRISKTGRTYYERRRNRSDKDKRKRR